MSKELRIPHDAIKNSQTITPEMERRFREAGLDLHLHDVTDLEDDFKKKVRKITVKNTRYHFL